MNKIIIKFTIRVSVFTTCTKDNSREKDLGEVPTNLKNIKSAHPATARLHRVVQLPN
jgi:hypothetical protein